MSVECRWLSRPPGTLHAHMGRPGGSRAEPCLLHPAAACHTLSWVGPGLLGGLGHSPVCTHKQRGGKSTLWAPDMVC